MSLKKMKEIGNSLREFGLLVMLGNIIGKILYFIKE